MAYQDLETYKLLLTQLFKLDENMIGNSKLADEIRDEMDQYWYSMSNKECQEAEIFWDSLKK